MGIGTQRQSKHLRWAGVLFATDFFIVWISFYLGILFRFGESSWAKFVLYGPGIGMASVALPSILYIGGLYSSRTITGGWIAHLRWLVFGFLAVIASVLMIGSLDFSSRVGRGVLLGSMVSLFVMIAVRHAITVGRRKRRYGTFLCLVADETDEEAAVKLFKFWGNRAKTFGIITGAQFSPKSSLPQVGSIEDLIGSDSEVSVDVILVRDRHFVDPEISSFLRGLRYEGAEILPISDACEDAYHAVPLEIITDAWLFRASTQSQLFYIRKLKRLSDVCLSALFLIILSPFLALGALLVKLASPGPIIFRQERAGRFGRAFTVLKLRTMHVEKEGGEARWATQEKKRIFPLGGVLRKFRVDEIPQLINVLRGEMSFVGPRPEQISIVDDLTAVLPFYRERLLIQPGITGWAQVNYPYGASVADAARKLEYELYYMKHMGIFLDFFILLETVKIILTGGVKSNGDEDYLLFREDIASIREELKGMKNGEPKSEVPSITP